jgi:XRE family transcriptional regulator, aerobic/anaerobic benzoate catabolism transcriptional regulator
VLGTILHSSSAQSSVNPELRARDGVESTASDDGKHPFLVGLGERVRAFCARRGLTRKALSQAADVSERHLANLEYGVGNASVLVLLQVAGALHATFAELLGDVTTQSPEWLLIRGLLDGRDETSLRQAREAINEALHGNTGSNVSGRKHSQRVALVGLRGAGKTTLGKLLAEDLGVPFIELSREIERLAGCTANEVLALYGPNAYRRYERRALAEAVQNYPAAVIATPGGLVSDPVTFNELLRSCTTVWLQAAPEDHMQRVLAQGDLRPISGNSGNAEAMADLKGILAGRAAFYGKADLHLNTSAAPLADTFTALRSLVRQALALSA